MEQIENLMQTLIEKNNEIADLKRMVNQKEKKGLTSLEKSMWAVLFVLFEKHVKCEKCGGVTRPATNKNNYLLARCRRCGHWQEVKRSKTATFNAYFDSFKRTTNG